MQDCHYTQQPSYYHLATTCSKRKIKDNLKNSPSKQGIKF